MNNAMSIYEKIIDEGYIGIQNMIGFREENLFLDFKEKSSQVKPGIEKSDKGTYAKALSGFSNSSGGVIVWGIKAKKLQENSADIAIELKPIKVLKTFLTDLNGLINEAVVPLNTGIINQAIYVNDDSGTDEGFIITYVPESDLTPHRAMLGDHSYYTRAGDSFIKMEHYMLEDSFGRRQKPRLGLYYHLNPGARNGDKNLYSITFGIKNTGKFLATYPAIKLTNLKGLDLSQGFRSLNLTHIPNTIPGYFAGGINDVIHPNTHIEVSNLHPQDDWTTKQGLAKKTAANEVLSFTFEIFASGCAPTSGILEISNEEIRDFIIYS
ncbi:ATP-binding protein [Paenibacillus sp. FSL P2-0089]|uniref:AlbA family DNA-binding domain-containing protein n=1 Tax=Paenibacillus sp. FSL P2-0089 TaxID=2954526 RepID=UPI00315A64A0